MKALAHHLTKYSFPLVSQEDEEAISCLKQREITLDGYELILYFNRCKYADVYLETLQIFGKYFSFLPFSLICKVATKFLGDNDLSLVEVIHNKGNAKEAYVDQYSRKIYVWTIYYDQDNNPIENPFASRLQASFYEGLRYFHLDRNQVTFF